MFDNLTPADDSATLVQLGIKKYPAMSPNEFSIVYTVKVDESGYAEAITISTDMALQGDDPMDAIVQSVSTTVKIMEEIEMIAGELSNGAESTIVIDEWGESNKK